MIAACFAIFGIARHFAVWVYRSLLRSSLISSGALFTSSIEDAGKGLDIVEALSVVCCRYAESAERFSQTARSRCLFELLFNRQSGRRGDLDHDTARSVAIESGDAAVASTWVLNLSRRQAGLREFIMLGLHGVGCAEVEADMKGFRIGGRVVLFRLHQRQDELILIAHQREGILTACHEALEPEEALEEGGEAAHIGGGEIKMFKLH